MPAMLNGADQTSVVDNTQVKNILEMGVAKLK